jgi:hypothetical protein
VKPSTALTGLVAALCLFGLLRHRVRRAGPMGGFRCMRCKRAFGSLDEIGEEGYASLGPVRGYSRDSAGGHAETTREERIS